MINSNQMTDIESQETTSAPTTSGIVWAGLFGVLDGIEGGANVEVFGLKKSRQPATFIGEAHRQHES